MDVSDAMRLRQFEGENARLRKMVAEQPLDIPQGCPVKKLLKPASCRQAVQYVQTAHPPNDAPVRHWVSTVALFAVHLQRTGMRISAGV